MRNHTFRLQDALVLLLRAHAPSRKESVDVQMAKSMHRTLFGAGSAPCTPLLVDIKAALLQCILGFLP